MKKNFLLVTCLVFIFLAGCQSATPLSTPQMTETPIPIATLAPTNTPGIPKLTLRLMAYNIWFGAGVNPAHIERGSNMNRLEDLITLVKQANPDILGLEEVSEWTS